MIGKILFEFILPAMAVSAIVWWATKKWFINWFGKSVDTKIKLDKVSKKYDKKLKYNHNRKYNK